MQIICKIDFLLAALKSLRLRRLMRVKLLEFDLWAVPLDNHRR